MIDAPHNVEFRIVRLACHGVDEIVVGAPPTIRGDTPWAGAVMPIATTNALATAVTTVNFARTPQVCLQRHPMP
jgi:hypothetical protein